MSKKTEGFALTDRPIEKNTEEHLYYFHGGEDARAYEFMGAHPEKRREEQGYVFRVWAPGARAVFVTGDFDGWDGSSFPMKKISSGVWETFVSGLKVYDNYKYRIIGTDGVSRLKADPFAFHAEVRPGTASKLYDLEGYVWGDENWIRARESSAPMSEALNIYEVHAGSWRRHGDGRFFSYADMEKWLIPYVKEMGYTHIEFLPLAEHPLDGSWGYQCTGYFAVTSRYGTPHDLMSFVDACHQAGIGVILDWVPAHFPKDAHGLYEFDGGCLYEYPDPLKREHEGWGTRVFDYGRREVVSFLMSSAVFWLDRFHADGLRVDAVASMLYLDYDRGGRAWRPNVYGGRENLEAADFLRKVNRYIEKTYPGALTIAEESTAWPLVTGSPERGGLGFAMKWNMGWMNDTLSYMQTDPIFRRYDHQKLTFSMMYAFSERFLLPLSHDEVVHGKRSLLDRMPGDYDLKFAGMRVLYGYMMAHPGKKLLFMGGEFGQFREWSEEGQLDWMLFDFPRHTQMKEYVRALNLFYLRTPALWQQEESWDGFQWIEPDERDRNLLAFRRIGKAGEEVIVLMNFAPVLREEYSVGLPQKGSYRLALSSDDRSFGGEGVGRERVEAEEKPMHGLPFSARVTLPPMSALYYQKEKDEETTFQMETL